MEPAMRTTVVALAAMTTTVVTSWSPREAMADPPPAPPNLKYIKKDTRAESRKATMAQYLPQGLDLGPWWLCGPFPFSREGLGDLDRVEMPEAGFDPNAEYIGKGGAKVRWIETALRDNTMMELRVFGAGLDDNETNNHAFCYLYREIRVEQPTTLKVLMGSDDGLKVWFNGRVMVSADVPRGWSADQHTVPLDLQPGVNKLLVKVSNGVAGWNYSFTDQSLVDPLLDAMLEYQLDLDFPKSPEDRYYRMLTIPVPTDIVLEVGGLDVIPDGRPAVATRRGDVWLVENAYDDLPFSAEFKRFASGLHEPLGLQSRADGLYLVQRGELTRLADENADDRADLFATVCEEWGVSGNYHEFGFGPKFDRDGNMWVTLNVGFCGSLGKSVVPWRGWAVKITPDGLLIPVCGGLRSPNGIGMNAEGDMFYTDNQGDWVGTNKLSHMEPGDFHGHPAGNRWYDDPLGPGDNPGTPAADLDGPIPMHEAAKVMPSLKLPAIWFPLERMGRSASDILCDNTNGRFGPFAGQLFVGDQFSCMIARVYLEKIDGEYQGACFPFRWGFECGVNRMAWGRDGSMFVGMTDRGWASIGTKPYGIQRLVWTGKTPFEVSEMRSRPDGFELTFTKPVDATTAADPASYRMISFTYWYHETYGSDEIMRGEPTITGAVVSADRMSVRLTIEGLRAGFVHELHSAGVRDGDGQPLLHDTAYYTLNRIPSLNADAGASR